MSAAHQALVCPPLALGRYRLAAEIGRGATARVYAADDLATGGAVALKAIWRTPELDARTAAEVRAVQRLDHPCLARLIGWSRDEDFIYLVSELVDGVSLSQLRRHRGRLGPREATAIVADVLRGLAHAHRRGVVHRDVKPGNILVDSAGTARLIDFGIARVADDPRLTAAGRVVGTADYMAPEHATGEPIGPAVDVYATCLVAYELLAGANPLGGLSLPERVARGRSMDFAPLGAAAPGLPPALRRAVMAGLDPDPRRRPAAAELAARLARLAAAPPRRRPGRPAALLGLGAAAALAAGAAAPIAGLLVAAGVIAAALADRARVTRLGVLGYAADLAPASPRRQPAPFARARVPAITVERPIRRAAKH